MPDVNVTIRHARSALYLLINGAVRDIENHLSPNTDESHEAITTLFDNLSDEMDGWEIPCVDKNRRDMIEEMRAALGNESMPEAKKDAYCEMLANFALLP